MITKISKSDWLRIGRLAGWISTAKLYRGVCGWCGKKLDDKRDNNLPLDEEVLSHGICDECAKKMIDEEMPT